MFWRVSSVSKTSPIDTLLDKDNFTLEELLEEDDIIQEAKSSNSRLLSVLQRPDSVSRLVHYVTVLAPESAPSQRRFRYPFAACELLCSEVDAVLDTLVHSSAALGDLFAPLRQAAAPDSLLAGYCARVVAVLVVRKGITLLAWLQARQDLMLRMVEHLGTTSVAETLVRLIAADEATAAFLPYSKLLWLPSVGIIGGLLSKLQHCPETDASENAAEVLAAIARARSCPLTAVLAGPQNLHLLVTTALSAGHGPSLVQALNVYIALLDRRQLAEHGGGLPGAGSASPASRAAAVVLEDQAVAGLAPHAAKLAELLSVIDCTRTQDAPWGLLSPPLGTARLTVIALVAVLLRTATPAAESSLMRSGAISRCLQLVRAFPLNSILHHQVAMMLLNTLEVNSDELLSHLCQECKLLDWIIDAPTSFTPLPCPSLSRGAGKAQALRTGYRGHLVQLANQLVIAGRDRPVLAAAFAAHPRWHAFVRNELIHANEVGNIGRWHCGRPSSQYSDIMLSSQPQPLNLGLSNEELGQAAEAALEAAREASALSPPGDSSDDSSSDAGSSDEQGAVIMSEDIDLEDGLMSTHQDEEEDEDEDEEDQKLRALSEDEQAGIDALLREVSFGSQPSCSASDSSSHSFSKPPMPPSMGKRKLPPASSDKPADGHTPSASATRPAEAAQRPPIGSQAQLPASQPVETQRNGSGELAETAPTDFVWTAALFDDDQRNGPVRPRRSISCAALDLQAAHSWPKMGLPRVRSREDARRRSLLHKEKRRRELEERDRATVAARRPPSPPTRPPPQPTATLPAVADVLEGWGAIPQTADKVASGEAQQAVGLVTRPGLKAVAVRSKEGAEAAEPHAPAMHLPGSTTHHKPVDLTAAAKRATSSGAGVQSTLHSSLNLISSAPHVHPDVPVDGIPAAVSPFASFQGAPFDGAAGSRREGGWEGYHSDESDEGECISSRSGSLRSEGSTGSSKNAPTGSAAKAALWNGSAWVVPTSEAESDSEDARRDTSDSEPPQRQASFRGWGYGSDESSSSEEDWEASVAAAAALGDPSSEEDIGENEDTDEDEDEVGLIRQRFYPRHKSPSTSLGSPVTREQLLGPLPEAALLTSRRVRHITSAPSLVSGSLTPTKHPSSPPTQEPSPLAPIPEATSSAALAEVGQPFLGALHVASPTVSPAVTSEAHPTAPHEVSPPLPKQKVPSAPIPIRQKAAEKARQAPEAEPDQVDSPVAHWFSPPQTRADTPHSLMRKAASSSSRSARGSVLACLARSESDEEDTLLGRFTKLDLSPSDISPGEPGSIAGTLVERGSWSQDYGSFQYWRPTYWQHENELDLDNR